LVKSGFDVAARADTTKNGTSRMIPLNGELRKILDGHPHHPDGRVFHQRPSKKYPSGDRPLSERRILRSLKRLCKRCGFENPKQYKLHTFRHAFASMLARANVPYQHALEFMGHEDSDILKMYITMFDKDAEKHIASIVYTLEIPVAVSDEEPAR
jgi:integrase